MARMRHPRAIVFEEQLRAVFDRIDHDLEVAHRGRFRQHPARPPHGSTASAEMDGLFNVGAAFSAGYGSAHGPGYVVDVRIATLDHVPATEQEELEADVARRLRDALPAAFPGRTLHVDRDGHIVKIHGDLSLGTL